MSRARNDRHQSENHDGNIPSGRARFEKAMEKRGDRLTPTERAVAAYIRDNLAIIPFETGASLASKSGVSEMSVVRAIHSLGYANLKELKQNLRDSFGDDLAAPDDVLERFQVRRNGLEVLRESLDLELNAVVEAYQLTETERWQKASRLIAERRVIQVVGFQAAEGLARDFANRLKYARQSVNYVEDTEGVYVEILEADPADTCLVLIDIFAYARKGVLLARKASELGIPIIVVTDRFSQFGFEFTDLVLQGHTQVKTFWDSTASISIILNLLINAVATSLGKKAKERRQSLADLGKYFQEFQPGAGSPNRQQHQS